GFSHRLNLFYLANDIIQNCKRKNAIVYRESFADAIPEAASLVKDPSVSKSVERVFKIWEERSVYNEETIASFRSGLIEERKERSDSPASTLKDTVGSPVTTQHSEATTSVVTSSPSPIFNSAPAQVLTSAVTAATSTPVTTFAKTVTTPVIPPTIPLALPNLANVDLGKISSILSSLTSVMKTTGVSPAAKLSPGTPTTPTSNLGVAAKPPVQSTPNPLANILSKVEITPESILSALSKTQGPSTSNLQGLSSLIQSVALHSGSSTISTTTAPMNTSVQTVKDRNTPAVTPPCIPQTYGYSPTKSNSDVSSTSVCKPNIPPSSNAKPLTIKPPVSIGFPSQPHVAEEKITSQPQEMHKPPEEVASSSLELKIHNFLKGNPGFSGLDLNIPILSNIGPNVVPEPPSDFLSGPSSTSLDNVDGTPVRDERSGTPTQDEIMDKPTSSNVDSVSLLSKIISPGSSTPSSTRSPLLNKEMPSYRPFGVGGTSPNAYRQATDVLEKPSTVDSSLKKFFPETSFHEDEDYRDFEYAGPPNASVDKRPTKPTQKTNMHLDSMEYPPNQAFGQGQDFRQPFNRPMQPPFNAGDMGASVSPSSDRYGGYNVRGNNPEAGVTSPPPKDDPFFSSDTNHNIPLLHSGMGGQSQFSESTHNPQNRHSNFHPKNNPPLARTIGSEQSGSNLSATTTIEFKNMLKNASRRPTEENKFGAASFNEDMHMPGRSHAGVTSEDRSEEQYRIETRVSSCVDLPDSTEEKGAPIETLGYHSMGNMRYSGEPIKTVESMRVGMKAGRPHGIDGSRSGWFEMGSAGSSFDDGPPSADEQPSVGGSTGGGGYKTQYEEHLPRFQDSVGDFRAKNIPFEHLLPPPPPPPLMSPLDRSGPFQMDQTMPPNVPPPGLPPDHGSMFPRDMPVPSRMQSGEPSKTLPHVSHPPPSEHGGNPFPIHHPSEHGGIPFSPPPIRNTFPPDHGAVHQGTMEHYPMHPRDHEPHSRENNQHNQPHGRLNEPMGPGHHGGFGGPPHHGGPHHMNTGGMRPQRPHFRPREPYHNNLKRPRPPFGRGGHFFSPKRPYYQPRY
ncbi:hypothetical protein GDO81_014937, partial [Engystomops pustulosus]